MEEERYARGYREGYAEGYDGGYDDGYGTGFSEATALGGYHRSLDETGDQPDYQQGDEDDAYEDGYADGYADGYDDGYDDGYQDGYDDGSGSPPLTAESSATAPAPAPPPGEAAPLITDVVGQPVDGPVVAAVLDAGECEIDGIYVSHYKCLADGIELSVDTSLNVSSVFLYADGVDDFAAFTGAMPYGLYWGAPWTEIESQWGPPTTEFELSDPTFDPRFTAVYEGLTENYAIVTLEFTPGAGQLIKATFTA